jgi:hypothetical protein
MHPELYHASSPEDLALVPEGEEPPHDSSMSDVALEALRTGLYPEPTGDEIPGEDQVLRMGDPDVDPLSNELSGDEVSGASMPTPDQSDVDQIGRAYGLANEDDGALVSAEELAERRDAHRWEAEPLPPK